MAKPTLLEYLAHEVVTPIVREDPAFGKFVYFGEYMPCAQFLFETTAVLGYIFRERIVTLILGPRSAGKPAAMHALNLQCLRKVTFRGIVFT